MSTNNPPQLQQQPCPKCNAPLSVTVPAPNCYNHLAFSQITVVHETGITCSGCGAYFVLGIAGANIDYMLTPVEPPAQIVQPVLHFPKRLVEGH